MVVLDGHWVLARVTVTGCGLMGPLDGDVVVGEADHAAAQAAAEDGGDGGEEEDGEAREVHGRRIIAGRDGGFQRNPAEASARWGCCFTGRWGERKLPGERETWAWDATSRREGCDEQAGI